MLTIRHCATALSLVLLLGLPACKTAEVPIVGPAVDNLLGERTATEERMNTAAALAVAEGRTEDALKLYERLYTNPQSEPLLRTKYRDDDIILNYAQLLRKTGQAPRALEVITPPVATRSGKIKRNAAPILINEYAAIQLELGNVDLAEKALRRVLDDADAAAYHADADNLLGISLDAKGQHKEAEAAFRRSLKAWKGDATSVMNNLAVCLAGQGLFDESILTLRQALITAPNKEEIARNIQLVSDLRDSLIQKAPKAKKTAAPKPLAKETTKAPVSGSAENSGTKNNHK